MTKLNEEQVKQLDIFNVEDLDVRKEVEESVPIKNYEDIRFKDIKIIFKMNRDIILEYRNNPDSFEYDDRKFLELFAFGTGINRHDTKETVYILADPNQVKIYFSILIVFLIEGIITKEQLFKEIELHTDPSSLVFLYDYHCYDEVNGFDKYFIPEAIERFWNIIDFDIHDKFILVDFKDIVTRMFTKHFIPLGNTYTSKDEVYGFKANKI